MPNARWHWPLVLSAIIFLLWIGKPLLVPIFLAALTAQLLTPLTSILEKRLPASLSILAPILALSMIGLALMAIIVVVSVQIGELQDSLTQIQQNMNELLTSVNQFFEKTLRIKLQPKGGLGGQSMENVVNSGGAVAVLALGSTLSIVATTTLVVVLAFLMLYYRRHLRLNILLMVEHDNRKTLRSVFESVTELGQRYVSGLGVVMAVVGIADTVGLLIVGAPFPVLFGLAGALAILIPYLGIAVVAPTAAALTWAITGSVPMAGGVLGVFTVVHLIEGHFVSPFFVGSKVNLNPLATLLAVVIGGELWGPAGMFLFIPLAGIGKLVLDTLPDMAPVARLMGPVFTDTKPPPPKPD